MENSDAQDGFPRDLLQCPIEDRVAYFRAYTMAHPKLVEVAQTLMNCIKDAEAPLIFVFGPTGVGKSTLLRRVSQILIEALMPDLEVDRGRIPIAGIEAMAPEFSQFDWKDFYLRALYALQFPFIGASVVNYGDSRLKLRQALEKALYCRKPDVFYIDEAQNLGKVASGRKLQDQTDCIKSLANLSSVQFVLVGTYEVLLLRNLSAQICRRTVDIHFPRYKAESSKDLKIFRSIVQTFQRQLPLEEEPDLISYWDFCYERSIGCVGILKDWLSRTYTAVLRENQASKSLSLKDLECCAPSLEKCMVMISKIREEENQLEGKTGQSELRVILGLEEASPVGNEQAASTGKKKRRGVGKPLPKRRAVGD